MRKKVNIGGSANGRPSLSESENFGSSPSPPAISQNPISLAVAPRFARRDEGDTAFPP